MGDGHDDPRETALSHSPSTPPLSLALGDFADPIQGLDDGDEPGKDDDDVANMLKGMKKKKSKKPKAEEGEAEGGEEAAADGGLDLSTMKEKSTARPSKVKRTMGTTRASIKAAAIPKRTTSIQKVEVNIA